VDLSRYPRSRLLECFSHHPLPVLAISTAIDISGFGAALQSRGLRFYSSLCCLISRAINDSPCFRHRLIDGVLVECPVVHPSINVALDDDSFSFADATHRGVFCDDYASIRAAIAAARVQPAQDFRDNLNHRFFLTHLPWLSFTGIQHPYTPAYGSIPLISTGRSFSQENRELLPIAVQAHHGLVDGLHVARLLEQLGGLCREPGSDLDAGG
jgi:chloramphenicol O-acetyltransferase type A